MKVIFPSICVMAAMFLTSCSSSSNFQTGTIHYGIVVSDINKSVDFYKSIGFTKLTSFEVPKEITGDSGLMNYKGVKVHVMTLNGEASDTKVKLLQSAGSHKKQDQSYIDSTVGMSYQTIFVHDMNLLLATLKKNNIKVLAKGPVDLTPVGFAPNFLTCIKDPDGNIIEFVGPMSK